MVSHTTSKRRAAAAVGLIVVAAYMLLAAVSGRLSPLARRPLLDGTAPPQAYRWVAPPPDLAATNIAPSALSSNLALTSAGDRGGTAVSGDGQITIIVSDGTIPAHGSDTSVHIEATPLDPATLGALGHDLEAFGNTYRIQATYRPSNTPVRSLKNPIDVVLLYPITVTLHTSKHEIASSADGTAWATRNGNDFAQAQQVEAVVPELGYVVVAGVPGAAPVVVSPSGSGSGGSNAVALGLIVAAGVALLVGLGLVLRNRRV